MSNRLLFFHSDSSRLLGIQEITTQVGNIHKGGLVLSGGGAHYVYIGSDFPFNNIYFRIEVPNTANVSVEVSTWDGEEFVSVTNLLDYTAAGYVGLANSGHIEWTPDKDKGWVKEPDSADIPEFTIGDHDPLHILDKFWAKIGLPSQFITTTKIHWIGHVFSEDADLEIEHPDLMATNVFRRYSSTKTDWFEQHVRAGAMVVKDLKKENILDAAEQILSLDDMRDMCVARTAQLIYSGMGDDFKDNAMNAENDYQSRRISASVTVDKDNDGVIDYNEAYGIKSTRLIR